MGSDKDTSLNAWRTGVKIEPVSGLSTRHVIHSYFNACPESPDGRCVLYYTSGTPTGELGDIRIKERATGKETILVENIATEDAHRVACQQWSNNGKTVVYHEVKDGKWRVMAVDIATLKSRILAQDRQLGFGSPTGKLAPIYGCHWNPGLYRDVETVHVETGEIHAMVIVDEVVNEYSDFIEKTFRTTDISLFFPVLSPDETKVFFKLSRPNGGNDFKSATASLREGKIIYDLENKKFLGLQNQWGHPSWTPDSQGIFEKGNSTFNIVSGAITHQAPSCISDHPSVAPGGKFFVTDGKVTRCSDGQPDDWGIAVGSMAKDDFVVLTTFDNTQGAQTWRHNHPHPTFSADGRRVYFNVNDGPWTRLMVAESSS
jgi:Tol biopolymer transport system component